MKKIIISALLLTSTSFYQSTLMANEVSNHSLGLEVINTNHGFLEKYGDNIFKENIIQINAFGQYNAKTNFFLEYGCNYMKGLRTATVDGGSDLPGAPGSILDYSYTWRTKIKQTQPYLGVGYNYFISNLPNTYFSLMGGVSMAKIKAMSEIIADEIYGSYTPEVIDSTKKNYKKTKPAIVLKAALNYKLTDHFGARVSASWNYLNHFKITSKPSDAVRSSTIKLKNYTGVGFGLFYNI
jgi:hypothetical protein